MLLIVEERLGEAVGDVHVEADVLARGVDGAEGRKVGLHAGDQLAPLLHRLERGLGGRRGRKQPGEGERDGDDGETP